MFHFEQVNDRHMDCGIVQRNSEMKLILSFLSMSDIVIDEVR